MANYWMPKNFYFFIEKIKQHRAQNNSKNINFWLGFIHQIEKISNKVCNRAAQNSRQHNFHCNLIATQFFHELALLKSVHLSPIISEILIDNQVKST